MIDGVGLFPEMQAPAIDRVEIISAHWEVWWFKFIFLFGAYRQFQKGDLDARQDLYSAVAEAIRNPERLAHDKES